MNSKELRIFAEGIEEQKRYLEHWRQPVEPLLFETLRAIDNVFCQELFLPSDLPDRMDARTYSLRSWGVNRALERMVPDVLKGGLFRLFRSDPFTQRQADEFLLQCGILHRAELLYGWLAEGLVEARLDCIPRGSLSGIRNVLVLKSRRPSVFGQAISRSNLRWVSDLTMVHDSPWEHELYDRHTKLSRAFDKCVGTFAGWGIGYVTTAEIDEHFLECGQIYLRRMWGPDLIGLEENIGGNQFNEYLGVLAALAGRAQKHLCFASILKRRNPELDLRNLLTTFAPYEDLVSGLASFLDAERLHMQKLLSSLTLEPANRDQHAASSDVAWAPIIRSSSDYCILPLYGLETNPFLFLLKDLEAKYPGDWSKAANNREKRWLSDLKALFPAPRWEVRDRTLKLKEGDRTLTDIDFVSYDRRHNEIALFQLKWQQPVGTDERARRSKGKNFIAEGDRWVRAVSSSLDKYGLYSYQGARVFL